MIYDKLKVDGMHRLLLVNKILASTHTFLYKENIFSKPSWPFPSFQSKISRLERPSMEGPAANLDKKVPIQPLLRPHWILCFGASGKNPSSHLPFTLWIVSLMHGLPMKQLLHLPSGKKKSCSALKLFKFSHLGM